MRAAQSYPQILYFFQGSNDYFCSSAESNKSEEDSNSLFGLTDEIIGGKLLEISENCNEEDWDGYGGKAITNEKIIQAEKLASLFDSNTIIPRVVPDPAGEIGFEWIKGDKRLVLTLDQNFLIYSEIDGLKNNFGKLPSNNFAYLPEEIIEKLQKNFSLV